MPILGSVLGFLIELLNLAATHPVETTTAAAATMALLAAKGARKPHRAAA
jgi:hypothetical protein